MSDRPLNDDDRRERLSMLLDGECDAQTAQRICSAWRDDPQARATWHAYHLIGDVLRSDDLANPVARDQALLKALRERLDREPVVLAPRAEPAPSPQRLPAARRRGWVAPAAVAAGFVAVAGVLVVTRFTAPNADDARPVLTAAPAGQGALRSVGASPADPTDAQAVVADGKLIRDARLDRYLAAHKQFGDSSAIAVPGVVLRSSATVAPAR